MAFLLKTKWRLLLGCRLLMAIRRTLLEVIMTSCGVVLLVRSLLRMMTEHMRLMVTMMAANCDVDKWLMIVQRWWLEQRLLLLLLLVLLYCWGLLRMMRLIRVRNRSSRRAGWWCIAIGVVRTKVDSWITMNRCDHWLAADATRMMSESDTVARQRSRHSSSTKATGLRTFVDPKMHAVRRMGSDYRKWQNLETNKNTM